MNPQAEMRPKEILSLILDGMDQNKTDLPHYIRWSNQNNSSCQKLRTHITGSIVHGGGKYFYLDYNQFPHDTNLSLSCLLDILVQEADDNGQLPPILYVQLDNTTRENKNKYFIGMMAYLVKMKIIREAWISFLIVGHTHEDVDQTFSKISHGLNTTNAITMTELHDVIRKSQQPVPTTKNVSCVWNISGWLEDYINCIYIGVTGPQIFKVFNDDTEHTTVKYKNTSTQTEWKPLYNEPPLEIFKIGEDWQQCFPTGSPALVMPKLDEQERTDFKRSIKKDFLLAQFTQEHVNNWVRFF